MDAIIELARRLGKAIADSPQGQTLTEARKAIDDEKNLQELLKDFQNQSQKIAHLEAEQKPVDVEDKHKLQELHDKLMGSEEFKKYTAAQVEYVDLMRKVNEALQEQLGAAEKNQVA
ncbi:MAG: YlbF family regulator [Planctomycetota bacterium]|jgi:cell fate (sporulation/competence/biofilm development) regulator YlbF (YheA/YmcA/DUF963 family)